MTTQTPNKTDSVSIIASTSVTHPTTIIGASISALTKRSVTIFMYHGYVEAIADTNPGKFMVQVRPEAGGSTVDEHWVTVAEYITVGTNHENESLTATEPIGETSLAVASTTNFAAGDIIFIRDGGTQADSEWGQISSIVTNTSVELVDGLTRGKDASDDIEADASLFICPLDLNAIESYRVLFMHQGAVGANGHIRVLGITHDSDNSA